MTKKQGKKYRIFYPKSSFFPGMLDKKVLFAIIDL